MRTKKNRNKLKGSLVASAIIEQGETCCWKNHFRDAPREVVGWLESLPSVRASRFCFARMSAITEGCNQYQLQRKPYSPRQVRNVLEFLRDVGIVNRVKHVRWNGRLRDGWIVVPHDCACDKFGAELPDGTQVIECKFQTGPRVLNVGPPDLEGRPSEPYVKVFVSKTPKVPTQECGVPTHKG